MTDSIQLQMKQGLVALIKASPGIAAAYLNRPLRQPVGENEAKPVAIIREDVSRVTTDNQVMYSVACQLRVALYFDLIIGEKSLDEISDPFWIAINNIMNGPARALPGVQSVQFLERQPEAEGEAGRLDLVYLIGQSAYQLDLTSVAYS